MSGFVSRNESRALHPPKQAPRWFKMLVAAIAILITQLFGCWLGGEIGIISAMLTLLLFTELSK